MPPEEKEGKTELKPEFMTKADMEAMLTAQEAKFGSMFNRLVETLTPPKTVETARGNEGERKPVSFYEKPEEAANALFEAKMAPMRDVYIANEKSRQLAEVAALPHGSEYIDEIKKVIEAAPPIVQATPGYAREAYNLVLGRHINDVIAARKKEEEKPKPEFTETVTAGAPAGRKSDALTAEQREAADGMGLTDDEYKQWRDNPEKMAAAAMAPQKKGA